MNKEIEKIIKKNQYRSKFYNDYKKKKPKKTLDHQNKSNNSIDYNMINKILNRVLISCIIFLVLLISKENVNLDLIYKTTFTNMNFVKVDKFITDVYGGIFPKPHDDDLYVNNTVVRLDNTITYADGVMVSTTLYSPVQSHVDGIVIKIYEDDILGKVIVIQDFNGYEYHYGYLEDISVSLYNRIKYGETIGIGKPASSLDKSEFYLSIKYEDEKLDVVQVINDED